MHLYNTLTRKKEPFTPLVPGKVGLYSCGITAYDLCHIGHARSAVVFDVLVRYFRFLGYDVTFVRNFTDVDDKIIARANRDGVTSEAVAAKYIAAFHEDMARIGVGKATVEPKATEHIAEMITLCETLIAQNKAYAVPSGDVYFRVRAFDQYGKLSGRNIDDMRSGARIAPGEEKEDPLDFALWKGAKPGEPSWASPWGQGRPGWHIECSAMSEKYLPLPFDIHAGGQDLIFPHHENEIAQTEAATGKAFARFWMHNGFVQINAEKMSKSLGNFTTIRDILENYEPEVLRLFLLGRQYRSPIDFTAETMDETEKNAKRLYETAALLARELAQPAQNANQAAKNQTPLEQEFASITANLQAAMDDDMNTAAALGHIYTLCRLANRVLDDKQLRKAPGTRGCLAAMQAELTTWGGVLGLLQEVPETFLSNLTLRRAKRHTIDTSRVAALMQERKIAREQKDFAAADKVRDTLASLGVVVRDTPEGAVWDIA